jgi:hypothetical protein
MSGCYLYLKYSFKYICKQMSSGYKNLQKLFLCCLGLFLGIAFCMKWMEPGFVYNGSIFTIIGLEISYPKEQVVSILSGLDEHVKKILRYHLAFDFAFMAAVYTGIAALCLMAREKATNIILKQSLLLLALLQLVAWGCDIYENSCLLKWIKNPSIGNEFGMYHLAVAAKWIIALTAALLAIPLAIRRKK